MVEQARIFADNENSIFALEPDLITPPQFLTQADRTDLTASSLEKFVKAQAADDFCQTVTKMLQKAGTKTTINKEEVLVRRAHIDRAQQKVVP